jgi:DNA-binding winged helix-turn-helix (wHTH) protein/predicted ATPase
MPGWNVAEHCKEEAMLYRFEDYTLDTQCYELRHAGVPCHLEPQVFAILRYLLAHRERVVSRQELLEHIWPERYISEATLDHRVMQARQAIGDSGQTQRAIQTLRGRGYRFVGTVEECLAPLSLAAVTAPPQVPVLVHSSPPLSLSPSPPPPLVGRDTELAQLHQWYAAACQGRRQVVCITGEMGLGKTTLVDAFLAQVAMRADLWVVCGQCINQHGPGEAYMPLLEALSQVGRSPHGGEIMALLHQYAPSWLLHLPALIPVVEREALYRRAGGATRERMLRELAEAVEALTTTRPLVLVLEDLHWSDDATLDWLVYMARRREPARLVILGTYRPVEAAVQAHPVRRVSHELQVHGQCVGMELASLSDGAVATYLAQRLPGARLPAGFARVLHQRTTGNPLFLVAMVDALVRQGVLRASATGWECVGDLTTVAVSLPETLRQLLERQVEQLAVEDQRLLEAASVAGAEFAVAAAAAAMHWSVEEVEERCAALARHGQFVRVCGTDAWPDGTVATRYGFLHALYREVLYERVPVGRRVRWHQQIGHRLEAGYEPQARELAAELAEHFVRGHDTVRAVRYLHAAGEQAMQRSAHQEALLHLTRGLTLLHGLPETPERVQQELDLQLALGPALIATKGQASPEVEQAYVRAQALCHWLGETPQIFPTLRGLWRCSLNRGALLMARELGERCLRLAQHTAAPTPLPEAHEALGTILFFLGEYAAAHRHLEQGLALIDRTTQRAEALRQSVAPGVWCLAVAANTLWCLGYPAQARRRCQEALALAQEINHPYSLAVAQHFVLLLLQRRREVAAVQTQAAALLSLATSHGFPLFTGFGTYWHGWALAMQSQGEKGLPQIHQGMTTIVATGQTLTQPLCLTTLAEAAGQVGPVDEGLCLLAKALSAFESTGRGDMVAEAYRLQGEFLRRQAVPDAAQAEASFQQALAIARRQQAKSWELRAAVSLSRLWQQQGKQDEAQQLLAPLYSWFTEGFDTADLQEAKALLGDETIPKQRLR